MENSKKIQKYPIKKLVAAIGIVVLVIIAMAVLLANVTKKEETKEIITKATLEKIINVSELSTFEAIYNGIAEVMNEKKTENVDYYVSYEARVKAGIDFEQIEISVDNEEKRIVVTIPEVKINDVNVDIGSLDYIFENDKANDETVVQEAYKACIEDAKKESSDENAICELAEQNTKNMIEALIKPFINQLDAEYVLEIK
ncbi:MAG: DUF4230 domain-containing protein [Lachnospiraceae bacterium]|nr:DUF4230 domain-containing protein [Lachnospiraceae bacterium]